MRTLLPKICGCRSKFGVPLSITPEVPFPYLRLRKKLGASYSAIRPNRTGNRNYWAGGHSTGQSYDMGVPKPHLPGLSSGESSPSWQLTDPHAMPSRKIAPFLKRQSRVPSWTKPLLRIGAVLREQSLHAGHKAARNSSLNARRPKPRWSPGNQLGRRHCPRRRTERRRCGREARRCAGRPRAPAREVP